jgi:hypothetical protein
MLAMKRQALIISHADGDGHLIAEQVRRNLSLIEAFDVKVVVDPERTKDHRAWMKLDTLTEIGGADFVFFMDLMFAPASFEIEANALVDFASGYPDKRFFLMDHHPLPSRRLGKAKNLRVAYRPDVFDCTLGPRSGMMVVAALCEKQVSEVSAVKTHVHEILAGGMRRAAALGGKLPGEKLLALLKADRWDAVLRLGEDDRAYHRLPRGRRPPMEPSSPVLVELEHEADALLVEAGDHGRKAMAYDMDVGQERFSGDVRRRLPPVNDLSRARDLEAIATLLEVAAMSLTTAPGTTFTTEQLIAEALDIAGEDLSERDIKIFLKKRANFLARVPGKGWALK